MIGKNQCEHGQLDRSCEICERDREIARLLIVEKRYEKVRRMNPRQFVDLVLLNWQGKGSFDDLVDHSVTVNMKEAVHPCAGCVWAGYRCDDLPHGCLLKRRPVNKRCGKYTTK